MAIRENALPVFFTQIGTTVKNGTIVGMPLALSLGDGARVHNLRLRWNERGIQVGEGSIVMDNLLFQNGATGISAGTGSRIARNAIHQEQDTSSGQGTGISVLAGSLVVNNAIHDGEGDGIVAGVVGGSTRDGVAVIGNAVRNNDGDGVIFDTLGNVGSGYRENVITVDTGTTMVLGTSVVDMGGNACGGNTTCP